MAQGAWPVGRLGAVALLACAVTLLALLTCNIALDPYGEFGSRGLMPPPEYDRAAKVYLLDGLDQPPQVLILGTSHSLKLPPGVVEARTGLRAFNAATGGGSAYDLLAFTRYALDQPGADLRAVILGLDDWLLEPTAPDETLLRLPLVAYLPEAQADPAAIYNDRLARALSPETTALALDLLYSACLGGGRRFSRTPIPIALNPDGTLYYPGYDDTAAAGGFPWEDGRARRKAEGFYPVYQQETLLHQRAEFEAWLDLVSGQGICLEVFAPPIAGLVRDLWREHSEYERLHGEYLAYVAGLQAEYGFAFYDLTDVESFGGDDRWFFDGMHTLGPNNALILEHLLGDGLCGAVGDAVQ